jgi:RNA polymerase-associated protein
MPTLYDAARCPYCARVRIVLAEKGIAYQPVEIDLDDRPAWIYDLNPAGRVPVLEDDGFVLPESLVVMEYLDERHPEPALMPADAADRAAVRLLCERFDDLGDPYYDLMYDRLPDARSRLERELARLDALLATQPYLSGRDYGLADIAYVPWILRAETRLGVDVRAYGALAAWLDRLAARPAIREELDVVARLYARSV